MATLEELVVRLEADNAKLVSALEESAKVTSKSAKQMEDAISGFSQNASKQTSSFGKVMQVMAGTVLAQIAVKAADLAAQAFGVLVSQFSEGVGEAAEFEQQMARLGNSLAMSGNFSKEAIDGLEDFIDKMEELSGVDDAVIAANLAMLSSITKLDAEGLKVAQQSAIDLAAGLDIDLGQATKLVAKAAEGSTDGFRKFGIEIQESADKGRTFADTLKRIESDLGGSALAKTKTFQGAVNLLSGSWGNLFQALGDVVVKNPTVVAVLKEVTTIIKTMSDSVKTNADYWRKQFADGIVTAINVLGIFAQAANIALMPLNVILKDISLRVQTVVDTFQAAAAVISGKGFGEAAEAFKETRERSIALQNSIGDMINMKGPLDGLVQKIAEIGVVAESAGSAEIKAKDQNKKKTQELTELEKIRAEQAKSFAEQLLTDSQSIEGTYQRQQEALQAQFDNQLIGFEKYKSDKLSSQEAMFAQEQAMLALALEGSTQYEAAKTQLEAQQGAQRLKTQQDLRKMEEDLNKQKLQGYSQFFGNLATLQSSSSREAFNIGKAAAFAQATVDGIAAIQGAYKQGAIVGGPGLGAAFAAAAGIATAANLAKISGTALASGIDSVPGVGSRDNFPAILAPGERVVPSETNKDLTAFLEKAQDMQQPAPVFNLNFYGPVWGSKAEAGAEIVEAINEALARGMSLRILPT